MRIFGFGGGNKEDEAAKQQREARREASRLSLEQGGLPLNAVDRLREQASRQGTPTHIFTSDLSVNEFLLVQQAGYEPLGQVMGSSIYHIGWQWTSSWSGTGGELEVLTQAYYHARHLALGRLFQEAALLGATGIVGVRLERKAYEWGAGLLEFAAFGTAIRESDAAAHRAAPFLSDLSGQEFWTLRQAGFRPVGFALGNCTYYQVASWNTQLATTGGLFGGAWQNQELPDFTQALYNARSLAMSRMEQEARAVGAVGVVGADVQVDSEQRETGGNPNTNTTMVFHYSAAGTAIAPFQQQMPMFAIPTTIALR